MSERRQAKGQRATQEPDEVVLVRLRVSPDELAEWEGLGLVARDADGGFDAAALERLRVLRFATDRGFAAQQIADLSERTGDVLGRYLDFLETSRPLGVSLEEAARAIGLEPDFVRRLWISSGQGDRHELLEDDVQLLQGLALAVEAGMPGEALVQIARVLGDSLARVADAEVRLFHFHVHEVLAGTGLEGQDLSTTSIDKAHSMRALVDPAVLYYHSVAFERAMREDMLLHLAEDVGAEQLPPGALLVAVLFVDLAGFTPLTETMGDAAASEVIDRFSDFVREGASQCNGRVIKQIGDEFMVVFPDGRAAVRFGLDLMARALREEHFPGLRLGAHAGPAVYREADYVGTTVNTAARVAGVAERGQFLATQSMRDAFGANIPGTWTSIGDRALKGLSGDIELFEIRGEDAGAALAVDPVCGMQVDSDRCDIHAERDGATFSFCSERCRDRFVAAPEVYV